MKIFKTRLYNILSDLETHKPKDTKILQSSIEDRLQKSLDNYNKSIENSYNYLLARNSLSVMKKLNRRK